MNTTRNAALDAVNTSAAKIAVVENAITAIQNTRLRESLATIWREAEGNLDHFKLGLEAWFNRGMERVTGWYKKRTQWVHLAIASVLVIFLNVDSLVVLRKLWSDGPLRQSLVAQAGKFAEKPPIEITAAGPLIRETLPHGAAHKQPARIGVGAGRATVAL